MKAVRRVAAALVGVIGLSVLGVGQAADAVRGKALFTNTNGATLSCGSAACHSGFPLAQRNGISKGSSPAAILSAISGNKGSMGFLGPYVNATDANDIAAYIANPAAGNGAATVSLSAGSLTFASQTVGATSAPQVVTLTNTGTAVLTLTAFTFSGTANAEFARGGTCQAGMSVAAGGNCSVQITFTPAAAGSRTATLTIAHNAGGTSAISLVGTGAPAAAAARVAPMSLSFTQTINTTSIAQAVAVSNTGGLPLTLGAIAIAGGNAAEFSIGAASTCAVGTVLNGGATCNLQLTFRPIAAAARTAVLSIAHSAAASPATVPLNGTGTIMPEPGASLSTASLSFATLSVGEKSAAQPVTLTNTGQAPLTLASLTSGGPAGGDFSVGGNCATATSLAPGAACTMQVVFAPTALGMRSGTLTVASNANNGNQVVSLTGSGVQYSISVNPASATLQAVMGAMSAPVQAVVTNTGASPVTLASIVLSGPFVLQEGPNSCGAGPMDLAPGQSCNVYVAFMPAEAGTASGQVMITLATVASPTRIALTAQATSVATASSAMAPSNVGAGCTVGPADQLVDPLLTLLLAAALFEIFRRRGRSSSG